MYTWSRAGRAPWPLRRALNVRDSLVPWRLRKAVPPMAKIMSRDGGRRPAGRTLEPIVVTRRGKIARLESSLTPHEAQIEDLVFIRKALNRADIPCLLVRNHKNRPILAVNIELRP